MSPRWALVATAWLSGCAAAASTPAAPPPRAAPTQVVEEPPPPKPASAPRVLTDPPRDDASTFVTDPTGTDYSSGAVKPSGAVAGGTGGTGAPHVPGSLARGPSRPTGTDCSALFPAGAKATEGSVGLDVQVDASGATTGSRVLTEEPTGEGFGAAARTCASSMHFSPALDANGAPTAGRVQIRVAFRNSP